MYKEPEIPLNIARLSHEEEQQFLITSQKEILFILHTIEHKQSRSALFFNDGANFLLTTVLDVNESGLWLGASNLDSENRAALESKDAIFVSSHYQVRVQFSASKVETAHHNDQNALYIPLPKSILRMQRRDYFRLPTPFQNPLQCVITTSDPQVIPPEQQVTIMDISVGGVALVCEEHNIELLPGNIYPNCQIELPDVGTLTASIKVKNSFEVLAPDGSTQKRAGCEFQKLDGASEIMLQRFISLMQLQRDD